jgi:hypothetical protein
MRQAAQQEVVNMQEAEDWISQYLKQANLRPDPANASGDTVYFHEQSTKSQAVVDEVLKAGAQAPIKNPKYIAEDKVRRFMAQALLAASPGGGKMGGKSPLDLTLYLSYTFIGETTHTPLKGGPDTKDQPAQQLQIQITAELHGKDESGVEISGNLSGTCFADAQGQRIQWQNVSGGAQIAWVQNFFDGNLQVSPQLQVSFGGSRAEMGSTQRLDWTPTGQVSAAGQAQFKVPGFKGQLMAGLQASVSVTGPAGSTATADRAVGFVLTYQF